MPATLTAREIEVALRERAFARVRGAIEDLPAAAVAESIEGLADEQRALFFRLLPRDKAAEFFEYLEPDAQEAVIRALGRAELAAILNDMSPDDRTALLEELPATVTRQLLALLSPEERQIARQLLGYPEDSVGRLMTPYVLAIGSDWTVQQALDHIRAHGEDSETLNVICVVDAAGRLLDDLRIRQLLLAPPTSTIETLMDGHFVALSAHDDQEQAVRVFSEYDRVAFPVTDSAGMLIGTVTVDDVIDVIEEEATEDIQKIGGTQALEHPYMQTGYLKMLRSRGGWLVLLFCGQLLTLDAIDYFSAEIERAIVLVLFIPLIISSGGNSGSQAATLVVRAIALDEVSLADWWRVMRREILFGITLGSVLASLGFLRILVGTGLGQAYGAEWSRISLVVGISLVGVVLWGVLIGSMLPFLMRRVGLDPAATSTPFVATIVDITGLILYFAVASAILF